MRELDAEHFSAAIIPYVLEEKVVGRMTRLKTIKGVHTTIKAGIHARINLPMLPPDFGANIIGVKIVRCRTLMSSWHDKCEETSNDVPQEVSW